MERLTGKVALATGAAGGIGAAIATMIRAEGARVAAADRDTSGIEAARGVAPVAGGRGGTGQAFVSGQAHVADGGRTVKLPLP